MMPYSEKQVKLFQAIKHGMKPRGKHPMSKHTAAKLLAEERRHDRPATHKLMGKD